jgi:hypothetical protein
VTGTDTTAARSIGEKRIPDRLFRVIRASGTLYSYLSAFASAENSGKNIN